MDVRLGVTDDEKWEYLRGLDVFVSCSLWEGFNLPLAEAQALGTVGLAFDVGAHPEVTPFVMGGIADVVRQLRAYSERRALLEAHSTAAYRFVRSRFSWRHTTQSLLDTLGLTGPSDEVPRDSPSVAEGSSLHPSGFRRGRSVRLARRHAVCAGDHMPRGKRMRHRRVARIVVMALSFVLTVWPGHRAIANPRAGETDRASGQGRQDPAAAPQPTGNCGRALRRRARHRRDRRRDHEARCAVAPGGVHPAGEEGARGPLREGPGPDGAGGDELAAEFPRGRGKPVTARPRTEPAPDRGRELPGDPGARGRVALRPARLHRRRGTHPGPGGRQRPDQGVRQGGVLGALDTSMDNFFSSVSGSTRGASDPHVRYDRLSGRWFVVIITVTPVPTTSCSPSAPGRRSRAAELHLLPFLPETTFTDYPTLGVDKNALYIGRQHVQLRRRRPDRVSVYVVRKTDPAGRHARRHRLPRPISNGSRASWTPQGVDNDEPDRHRGLLHRHRLLPPAAAWRSGVSSTPGRTPDPVGPAQHHRAHHGRAHGQPQPVRARSWTPSTTGSSPPPSTRNKITGALDPLDGPQHPGERQRRRQLRGRPQRLALVRDRQPDHHARRSSSRARSSTPRRPRPSATGSRA